MRHQLIKTSLLQAEKKVRIKRLDFVLACSASSLDCLHDAEAGLLDLLKSGLLVLLELLVGLLQLLNLGLEEYSASTPSLSLPAMAAVSSSADMAWNFSISAFWLESQSGLPAAVQSTSPTRADACPSNSAISLSHAGFIDLQWPHQGAWNLMRTVLPATAESQLAGVSSVAEAAPIRARRRRADFMLLDPLVE